jgi:hypothetical protein
MKKMVTRSMVFALGASIFLFSEHVFGNTVIYDPLDPQNTITPITEQEVSSETSESAKIDGQIELEETETTSAQTTLETKNTSEKEQEETHQENPDHLHVPTPEWKKENRQSTDFPPDDPYLPMKKRHPENQVLILNETFFSQEQVVTPPNGGDGGSGAPNDFPDIAQSAYLLSGVVLYGEANGKLEARVSDRFAR